MGERAYTRITVGGKVPLKEFAACVEKEFGLDLADLDGDVDVEETALGKYFQHTDPEQNNGCFDDFEGWLIKNKISFDRHNDACSGAYGASTRHFRPGEDFDGADLDAEVPTDDDGWPILRADELRKRLKEAKSIEAKVRAVEIMLDVNCPEPSELPPIEFTGTVEEIQTFLAKSVEGTFKKTA